MEFEFTVSLWTVSWSDVLDPPVKLLSPSPMFHENVNAELVVVVVVC